ncbi:guanine nucleotide-binding protein alpha-1 subunit-like [Triticum aestivum]|uniref:guanine nucleotide-binding protein alpha-1 subunit-like n=1 Tax=Triticum aestivum TaxID=4565 RepID=UPI001D02D910|nr:guanine nucleotide-binding protein alpha-1 subunit-like [Triticum aestivum]
MISMQARSHCILPWKVTIPVTNSIPYIFLNIYLQINLLFWTGFDVAEYKGYTTVNHVIVYQTIKLMYDGAKELAQGESDYSKYAILPDNQLRNKLREAEPDPDDSQNQAPLLSLSLAPTLQMANNTLPATAAVQLRASIFCC